MPLRKNNSGKSSGPYKKQDGKKTGDSFKSSGRKPGLKNSFAPKDSSFKGKPRYNNDPDELAPPRFFAPREQNSPYGRKGPDSKRPSDNGNRGRTKDRNGFGSDDSRPFKNKFSGGSDGPYKKPGFKSADGGGNSPYKKRETGTGDTYRKTGNTRNGSDSGGNSPYKKRETGSGDSYRKSGNNRFGSDSGGNTPYKKRDSGSGEGGYRKPGFPSSRPERGGNSPFNKRETGAGEDRFKKPGFQRNNGDDRSNPAYKTGKDADKPFRPKYDPEVKTKKTYTDRKKELTGVKDDPDDIRLNKYIANSGVSSRREADEIIKQGLVSVNGVVVTEMGHRVKKGDVVRYDGQKILPEPFVYIVMNKPKDFITTTDDEKGRKTVMDLLADKITQRVYPIGRLDRNTTGVLLLTNDGEVAQALTHPSFQIKKVYHVVLDKKVSGTDLDKLVEGVELEDGQVHADAVAFVDNEDKRHVGVEIHSGKNRVVRRMFEHLGYEVEKLDRVSMGIFTKKDLPRGKWRYLNQSEIGFLMKLKSKMP